ncbi:ankyrin repeat-containing domain protein, partial [Trichophaea hybrida]
MIQLFTNVPGVDVNYRDSLRRTPLILACIAGHGHIVTQLLKHNASILIQDYYGRTALHYASMGGHTSIVRTLSLYDQSSIDINDRNGKSPLNLAIENDAGSVVALLFFYGAKDPDGQ